MDADDVRVGGTAVDVADDGAVLEDSARDADARGVGRRDGCNRTSLAAESVAGDQGVAEHASREVDACATIASACVSGVVVGDHAAVGERVAAELMETRAADACIGRVVAVDHAVEDPAVVVVDAGPILGPLIDVAVGEAAMRNRRSIGEVGVCAQIRKPAT